MEYANVSVKFPKELDSEIEGFLDEMGVYTNKSEFIKEAVRRHLGDLNNDPAIAALRVEQLLGRAEQAPSATMTSTTDSTNSASRSTPRQSANRSISPSTDPRSTTRTTDAHTD